LEENSLTVRKNMDTYKRILIIRTDRIGDVLLSTPVIKVLRERFPSSFIAFMARPYAEDIVKSNPYLNEVIVYDKYGVHKSFLSTLKFALALRRKKFDIALILHPTNRAHIITFLAQIPKRIGYRKKFGFLLTDSIEDLKYLGEKHESAYNFDLLKTIGIENTSNELCLPINEEDRDFIDSLLKEKNILEKDKIIAVNPTASCRSKIWSPIRFGKVCRKLVDEFNVKIGLICSEKDIDICRKVASFMEKRSFIILSGLKLKQLACFLKNSELLISNDSAPVHIAAAVGTPVISIFGRNQAGLSPTRWRPLGKEDIVLHREVGCRICLAHNCQKEFECLKAITDEDVLNAARKFRKNFSS
jgi:lipopolysaccharide heptosyltransferase II